MLYIVKAYDNGDIYEYEYGNLEHAKQHLATEKGKAEIYKYVYDKATGNDTMTLIDSKE